MILAGMHLQEENTGLPALQFRHEGCAVRMCHIFVNQKNIELHLIGEGERFSSAPRGGSVPFTPQEMVEFNQYSFVTIHNQDFDRITDHTLTPIDSWQALDLPNGWIIGIRRPTYTEKRRPSGLIFQADASRLL